ncbi:ATP-grasp domain-containing protein [Mycolicibacterium sp. CBMA 226]|uniref:ATP-grasp domain-containing protein n=1 Tax=Mycolicibacterium sp. CBMA 226 TaxID=2606611 RepID=UPI0012DE460F|nr:ATP-grasp domain-containing protein [Mycolicibacterium sp. CBMA 226]MUL78526.1 ATP-grasp domain-containing protein [Mycolicibacterium sp. CBMA 226]
MTGRVETRQARGAGRSRTHKPAVVMFHHARFNSMEQLAVVARRGGATTVLVTCTPTGRLGRLSDCLLYRKRIYLSAPSEMASIAACLSDIVVADVQATEDMASAIPDSVLEALPQAIAADVRQRRHYSDKAAMARLAAEHGVRIPRQIPVASVRPERAIAELGLPLVVKSRVGASGRGVVVASTETEVRDAIAVLGPPEMQYYERYIRGRLTAYSAIVSASGIVQEVTCQSVRQSADPTFPPIGHEVIEDSELTDIGRIVCAAAGLRGPINMQTIKDEDGNHWLIDVNLRPFGTMLAFDQTVLDTAAAYLVAVGLTEELVMHRSPPIGLRVTLFPDDAEELVKAGRRAASIWCYVRRSASFWSMFGLRYPAFFVLSRLARKVGI